MASACLLAMELNSHPLAGFGLPSIIRFWWSFQYRIRNHSSFSMILFSSAAFPLRYLCKMASASLISAGPIIFAPLSCRASAAVKLCAGCVSGGRISASRVWPPGRAPCPPACLASIAMAASAAGAFPACPPGPALRCMGAPACGPPVCGCILWRSSSGLCLDISCPPYTRKNFVLSFLGSRSNGSFCMGGGSPRFFGGVMGFSISTYRHSS